ncbi:uncharacterized protein METZ01_LOCUS484329 [marine metagenome]|uniref:Uncharacterized protein n=1 Tax=marine metagenome TaxID=408172 RepID=A0A383CIC2_9ZZZZ
MPSRFPGHSLGHDPGSTRAGSRNDDSGRSRLEAGGQQGVVRSGTDTGGDVS